jgi:hypothetical protein
MRTLLLLAVASSMTGCMVIGAMHSGVKGSGKLVKKTLTLSAFKALQSKGVGDITVAVGGTQNVVVEVDENLAKYLKTNVEDGVLVLNTKKDINPTKLHYTITVPSLSALTVDGVGDSNITGLKGGEFAVHVNGVGDVKLEGSLDKLQADVKGVGDLNAYDLKCKDAKIEVQGVGDAHVNVSGVLDATVQGTGDITYKGSPAKVNSKSEGVGSISKAG